MYERKILKRKLYPKIKTRFRRKRGVRIAEFSIRMHMQNAFRQWRAQNFTVGGSLLLRRPEVPKMEAEGRGGGGFFWRGR